jgi:hypothetical protein
MHMPACNWLWGGLCWNRPALVGEREAAMHASRGTSDQQHTGLYTLVLLAANAWCTLYCWTGPPHGTPS